MTSDVIMINKARARAGIKINRAQRVAAKREKLSSGHIASVGTH